MVAGPEPRLVSTWKPLAAASSLKSATAARTSWKAAWGSMRDCLRPDSHAPKAENTPPQPMKPIGFAIEEQITLPAAGLVGNAVLGKKLGDGPQSGQRRAELVGDRGYKVGLKLRDAEFLADAAMDRITRD